MQLLGPGTGWVRIVTWLENVELRKYGSIPGRRMIILYFWKCPDQL